MSIYTHTSHTRRVCYLNKGKVWNQSQRTLWTTCTTLAIGCLAWGIPVLAPIGGWAARSLGTGDLRCWHQLGSVHKAGSSQGCSPVSAHLVGGRTTIPALWRFSKTSRSLSFKRNIFSEKKLKMLRQAKNINEHYISCQSAMYLSSEDVKLLFSYWVLYFPHSTPTIKHRGLEDLSHPRANYNIKMTNYQSKAYGFL